MSSNAFSEVQKPAVFTVVSALRIYRLQLLVVICGYVNHPKPRPESGFSVRDNWKRHGRPSQFRKTQESWIVCG